MQERLQALLDKIRQEGVAKGEGVAAAIINDAEKKARRIVEEAEREAAAIRREAEAEAEAIRRNVTSEVRLSVEQALDALKQKISQLIAAKAFAEPLQQAFSEETFLKQLIEKLLQNWQGASDITLILPESHGAALQKYFKAKAKELFDGKLAIRLHPHLENGFQIEPADAGYLLSFTAADFERFIMDYLRPKTKEILYGTT